MHLNILMLYHICNVFIIVFRKVTKPYRKPTKLKTALFWLCGIESSLKKPDEVETPPTEAEMDTSIYQEKFWSNLCDINAVIALALSGFVIAFLNKF